MDIKEALARSIKELEYNRERGYLPDITTIRRIESVVNTLTKQADRREIVARIIDPDTYHAYDIHRRSGTVAENGKPWADVVCGKDIAAALAKADAILSALDGGRDA